MDARVFEFWHRSACVQGKLDMLRMAVAARAAQTKDDDYIGFTRRLEADIFNLQHGVTQADLAERSRQELKKMGGG